MVKASPSHLRMLILALSGALLSPFAPLNFTSESSESMPSTSLSRILRVCATLTSKSLEQQVVERALEQRKDYRSFKIDGEEIGIVNGLAVHSADPSMSEFSGIVLPIVAEVTPAGSQSEGKVIATGKLGEIAKESVLNISALIKKYMGRDISRHDIHIQFIGTYEGLEGDSASLSVITAVISAMEGVPIKQEVAMTGSLSIRGTVLPIGGVTAKVEAAAEAGIKKVLIPKSNLNDVLIEDKYKDKIEIIPVNTLTDVLNNALTGPGKQTLLKKLKEMRPPKITGKIELDSEQSNRKKTISNKGTYLNKNLSKTKK